MWDLIVSVPDHCLSFYFETVQSLRGNPINVTRKFYDVPFVSRFVTSALHLHKAQNDKACHMLSRICLYNLIYD